MKTMSQVWQASIVMSVGQKYGWLDLIPFDQLFEFLRYLIDNVCVSNRDDFCSLMKRPNYRQERAFERRVSAWLRRRRINVPQGREFASYQIVNATFETCESMPDEDVKVMYDKRAA